MPKRVVALVLATSTLVTGCADFMTAALPGLAASAGPSPRSSKPVPPIVLSITGFVIAGVGTFCVATADGPEYCGSNNVPPEERTNDAIGLGAALLVIGAYLATAAVVSKPAARR